MTEETTREQQKEEHKKTQWTVARRMDPGNYDIVMEKDTIKKVVFVDIN